MNEDDFNNIISSNISLFLEKGSNLEEILKVFPFLDEEKIKKFINKSNNTNE